MKDKENMEKITALYHVQQAIESMEEVVMRSPPTNAIITNLKTTRDDMVKELGSERWAKVRPMKSTRSEVCCFAMESELMEGHITRLDDGRWFLPCMNPITVCPFCGEKLIVYQR